MQINDETFVCDSCEVELALEQQCDHDTKTVHHWCIDCCKEFTFSFHATQWEDLD
jgi:hypothetical protein